MVSPSASDPGPVPEAQEGRWRSVPSVPAGIWDWKTLDRGDPHRPAADPGNVSCRVPGGGCGDGCGGPGADPV